MEPSGPATMGSNQPGQNEDVVVHPLVLLSAADHYRRVLKDAKNRRVVGVLLGTRERGTVDVTNSFAVPFEEDPRNPAVWFLDHNYLESMYWMFKKVNTRENIVGFYSTGPKVKENDLAISDLLRRVSKTDPIFVVIDVRPDVEGLPLNAYYVSSEIDPETKTVTRVLRHMPCSVGAQEAEEVGVEHLLRDVNDKSKEGTLASAVRAKVEALGALAGKLTEVRDYLQLVLDGSLTANNQIMYNLQDIFNLLPQMNDDLASQFLVKSNDTYLVLYLGALVRSVLALHNLVLNKISYVDEDRDDGAEAPTAAAAAGAKKSEEKKDDEGGAGGGDGAPAEGASEEKGGAAEQTGDGEGKPSGSS